MLALPHMTILFIAVNYSTLLLGIVSAAFSGETALKKKKKGDVMVVM